MATNSSVIPDLIFSGGHPRQFRESLKKRFREEIGEWMQCSIGVGTNRFLAKLAASLHKPDGLDVIDHTNVFDVYKRATLIDLSGINTRFQARLNAYGIFTPMEFYQAPMEKLKKTSLSEHFRLLLVSAAARL